MKGILVGHLFHEVLRLIDGAQVGADGDLRHIGKAQLASWRPSAWRGSCSGPNWLTKAGATMAMTSVAALDGLDQLEDLALVDDGAEGAVDQAHAAGYALVVIDLGTAVLIRVDGAHAAGGGAGPLGLDDGAGRGSC